DDARVVAEQELIPTRGIWLGAREPAESLEKMGHRARRLGRVERDPVRLGLEPAGEYSLERQRHEEQDRDDEDGQWHRRWFVQAPAPARRERGDERDWQREERHEAEPLP